MASKQTRVKGDDDESEVEYRHHYDDDDEYDQRLAQEIKVWNLFREFPVKKESASMATSDYIDVSVKFLKLLSYIIVFIAVLGSSVVAKGTLLFITSQFKKGREISHCNKALALDKQFKTILPLEERIAWLWAALIVFGVPELGVFLRSVRMCLFKKVNKPTIKQFVVALVIETLQTIGVATLLLIVLPELDVLKGAMLMNAVCFVPGLLNAFSRDSSEPWYIVKILLDVLSTSAQATAFVVWPLVDDNSILWSIIIGCVLTSLGWWENFVKYIDVHTSLPILYLCILKKRLKETRYYTQRILSPWKIVVFIFCTMVSLALQGDNSLSFFTHMFDAFGTRNYTAREFQINVQEVSATTQMSVAGLEFVLPIHWQSVLWVAFIQVASAYFCYISSVFACKILIQKFSFTFALSLAGPVAINFLISFCALRNRDPCAFRGTIPDYLFFEIPPVYYLRNYVGREMTWVWLLWLASQGWITAHAWASRCERLAAIDKLFAKPWYLGPLIDQSLLLNRTTNEEFELEDESVCKDGDNVSYAGSIKAAKDVKSSDSISRIYACATMWHESKEEMKDCLMSMFRLDEDQSARRVAQKYLGISDKDYYELEVHIFMDDAFEKPKRNKERSKIDNEAQQKEVKVNRFAKMLVETVDEAASEVHLTNVSLRPPKKYPTPYGGRLEWTMPGKNILVCHLKDKSKIRHKKRWSQVMYMYYFLGHRLMDTSLSVDRKDKIAENTYLLALDGDMDFRPSAVTLLIDLMKKNKNLGAACGRVHPVGSGFMTWYQKFEYAIGHWLQKATEHMIGCVLCSPGCFSLFRGKALMDDNIMKKYTLTSDEARHFVQHDQGEDRWLCTLLLQRGYRVEYSAASDAYTHCPDSFNEFYNQRRRWVPSTTANILDLLTNYKRTVQANENISTLYVIYQSILMAGTVLGPGTIFLMMIGAMNAIIKTSIGNALLINLVPVLLFLVVCMTCKAKYQLFLAALITCVYAMVMLVVMMGIALQIVEDGWMTPSSIFTIAVVGMFVVTAALHPQEFFCLIYIVVYYITIPSMYILLIIYSVCNLNDVTWGTREVAKDETDQEEETKSKAVEKAKKEDKGVLQWFDKNEEETSGNLECGVAGLFCCICCTNPKDHKDDLHLLQISTALDKMQKRLDFLGAPPEPVKGVSRRRRQSSVAFRTELLETVYENAGGENSIDVQGIWEERDDLVNPYWIEDPKLKKGEVDYLPTSEIVFWDDLIEAYLKPIDEDLEKQERIGKDLKHLRDKMVFAFVMLNAMFVLVIFLLQLNQDQLHFKWPFGQKVNISYVAPANIVLIERAYLQLEPLGFLFLVFFGIIITVQFVAMLFHRLGTLSHLLSTCKLSWYCTKKPEDLTEDALMEKRGVNIAKDLQKLNTNDVEQRREDDTNVSKRKVIHNIETSRGDKQSDINLQNNFRRRLEILQNAKADEAPQLPSLGVRRSTRRATLKAIQTRRNSLLAEIRLSRAQSEPNSAMGSYDRPSSLREMAIMQSMSGAYVNKGYEPAIVSDDESTTERKTTVRLK